MEDSKEKAEFEPFIRAKIRADLPPEAFRPQPRRLLYLLPLVSFLIAGTGILLYLPIPWYVALPGAILVGNFYATLGFFGHEIMHGTIVRSRRLQHALGYLCFLPWCIPSPVWRNWHVELHHEGPNSEDDPDGFGTLERFRRVPLVRFSVKYLAPGSGRALSLLFPFYWLLFRNQLIIWKDSTQRPGYERLNRRRAKIESLLMIGFWIALAVSAGLPGAVFGVLIPVPLGGAFAMFYIMTNHFVRPQANENGEQFEVSMSVKTWKLFDWMHLNFSHHIEHHLFPNINWKFTPLVRKSLIRHAGNRFLCPPRWKSLWAIYHTPRVYKDGRNLVNPYTGRTVSIADVDAYLRDSRRRSFQSFYFQTSSNRAGNPVMHGRMSD